MVCIRPRDERCSCEEEPHQAGQRPGGDGPPRPLQHLPEVVGIGHEAEERAPGEVVLRVLTALPHAHQLRVSRPVQDESDHEQHESDDEAGIVVVVAAVVHGADELRVDVVVNNVCNEGGYGHPDGDPGTAVPRDERVYEGPVDVVGGEQSVEGQVDGVVAALSRQEVGECE